MPRARWLNVPERFHPDGVRARVFVVGCPRSGTTLAQSVLAAHPAIVSFPESHLFCRLRSPVRWRRWMGLANPEGRTRYVTFLRQCDEGESDPPVVRCPPTVRGLARAFIRKLDEMCLRHGGTIWVEKTPDHLNFIWLIEKYAPRARYVHVIRAGADVVASLYDVTRRYPGKWQGPWTLARCVEKWNRSTAVSRRYVGHERHFFLRYEDLVNEPERSIGRLCDFLDVPYSAHMIEQAGRVAHRLITDEEPWKAAARGPLAQPERCKFETLSSDEQADVLTQIVSVDELLHEHARQGGPSSLPAIS